MALVLPIAASASCGHAREGSRLARATAATAAPLAEKASTEARVQANTKCEGCHEEVAREWRGSRHRAAATNARFMRGFDREPLAWCVGCHAPAFDTEEPLRAAADIGVSCIDCHRGVETKVAAAQAADHRTPGPANAASPVSCGTCHEFPFPNQPSVAMQWTVTEHRRSSFAQTDCGGCHMPPQEGRPHRDHRFEVSDAMIRQSSSVEVSRTARGISFELRAGRIGHAFPTGDTFRRIRIEAQTLDASARVVEQRTRLLSRRMPKAGPGGRAQMEDDRLFLADSVGRIELAFERPERTIRYRIAYERAESERDEGTPQTDVVELAHGSLPKVRRP
ncbi:MAG: hypothetical protein HOO96_29305 [Polyangiaceae bacterium]|nr:hypothetical protein [Polyangiaceae bacterium]